MATTVTTTTPSTVTTPPPARPLGRSTQAQIRTRSIHIEPTHDSEYLTPSAGATGREPNTNPPDWPSDRHRRVPPHRAPRVHPDWVAIGGPLPMRVFLWNMFSGCRLLQWAYAVPRALGYHRYGPDGRFMYKVAGEW
ncbi:hypothetical protein BJX66DRAFT_334599 [Aspergillus keveii]|uniref:Uncharacterized protein n=1 Tax=Aspergillus keveii TaxID=714993 RepID=A0ABR4GFU7_9EURO